MGQAFSGVNLRKPEKGAVMAVPMLTLSVGSGGSLGMRQSDTSALAFAGAYVPIAVYSTDLHVYIFMIKQNGAEPIPNVPLEDSAVFQKDRLQWHPKFFEPPSGNSAPRLRKNAVPQNHPVVSVLLRPFPSETVEIRFHRVVNETKLTDITKLIVSSAAWNCGKLPTVDIDRATLTITQRNSTEWADVQPPPRPPYIRPFETLRPVATHEELGARRMLRLSVDRSSPSSRMGAFRRPAGYAFAGDYVPIVITAEEKGVSMVMVNRAGSKPVRETAMSESGPPERRTLFHPDFYVAPVPGGPAGPRPIPGALQANAPIVSIVRSGDHNELVRFGRVRGNLNATAPVAEVSASGPQFAIELDGLQLTGTWVR